MFGGHEPDDGDDEEAGESASGSDVGEGEDADGQAHTDEDGEAVEISDVEEVEDAAGRAQEMEAADAQVAAPELNLDFPNPARAVARLMELKQKMLMKRLPPHDMETQVIEECALEERANSLRAMPSKAGLTRCFL